MTAFNLDRLPDGVLILDATGCLIAANAAAHQLLGPLEGLVGQPVERTLGLRLQARSATASGTEITLTHPVSGSDVYVVATIAAESDGSIVMLRPASEHSGIAVVSTVAHELRSPLTSVKGYVSLMLNRWDRIEDDRKREMLTQVNNDADRVTRLITELLDISRLEAGRLVLRRQLVDLAALATTVVDKVTMAYPDLDCSVAIVDVPEVYADPDKLEQVLTNLVENSAKYGNPRGMRIIGSVRSVDTGEVAEISVCDLGEGIPAEDLPKVFSKFFRRDHGRPTGTGLGLWISRGLVEVHGGALEATSEIGVGSTFTFTLPIGAFEDVHD